MTAATSIIAARVRHVRKCLLSSSQDGQCPTRSAEQDHGRLHCLNGALRVLEGCNKEGARGRHVRACAAWLCLVCQASRPRRTLRSSEAVIVIVQASFEPSLSSFCDFPTSPYLPVLPSDPGRWCSHLCCARCIQDRVRRAERRHSHKVENALQIAGQFRLYTLAGCLAMERGGCSQILYTALRSYASCANAVRPPRPSTRKQNA